MTAVAFFSSHAPCPREGRVVGVLHRPLDPAVSEDRLQPCDAAAVLEIVGREGVPQIVGPDVSGAIGAVSVVDNQYVHRGDGFYVIDPERFRLPRRRHRPTSTIRCIRRNASKFSAAEYPEYSEPYSRRRGNSPHREETRRS
ncbi:hypothetical protein KL86APRO_11117 [uncultured Alphaproteobacteria bacterium]|uniref:Uncharacterized protein n=1 Tax=uncultured Alphaproteobacteria bacterium TaxID=91750 RepID=A0A212JI81_9PROT|nr:hypothetical protein KL86APRO_11117 [uncultured Alphaproteobacteria bacterium]